MFSKLLDFIFPPSCPICSASVSENGMLCHQCWGKFHWISDPKCSVCGYPFPANLDLGARPMCPVCAAGKNEVDWMRSACVYDKFSKNVMLPFKHAGQVKFCKVMSRAMIFALREMNTRPDIVMPVPLANRRLFKRGYNQATLLARPIAKHFKARLDVDSIWREYREDMGNKTAKQRAANVRGVFHIMRPERIKGRTILLVDDVMTSGATFAELRRILKKAGAAAVYGISFCRVVRAI